jgi:hypothetical protein
MAATRRVRILPGGGGSMLAAADISRWWDTQHRIHSPILNGFISDHPDWFGVVAAAGNSLPPESRAGSVDLLRFGPDGTRRHTRNLSRDGLSLLQVGPRNQKPGKFTLRRVIVRPSGGFLAWANAGEALRVGGAKAFASVDDLARAVGQATALLLEAYVWSVAPLLQSLGARVRFLRPKDLTAITTAVRGESVVLFGVQWSYEGKSLRTTLGAFRDVMGELRFTDRAGNVGDSLAHLETLDSGHAGIRHATLHDVAASIDGVRMLMVRGRAVLAMEVRMQLAADPVTVAQALAVRAHVIPPLGTRRHVLISGDDLCSLAATYYGSETKWPLIEEANRDLANGSTTFLTPGDTLLIYPPPPASALDSFNGWAKP